MHLSGQGEINLGVQKGLQHRATLSWSLWRSFRKRLLLNKRWLLFSVEVVVFLTLPCIQRPFPGGRGGMEGGLSALPVTVTKRQRLGGLSRAEGDFAYASGYWEPESMVLALVTLPAAASLGGHYVVRRSKVPAQVFSSFSPSL